MLGVLQEAQHLTKRFRNMRKVVERMPRTACAQKPAPAQPEPAPMSTEECCVRIEPLRNKLRQAQALHKHDIDPLAKWLKEDSVICQHCMLVGQEAVVLEQSQQTVALDDGVGRLLTVMLSHNGLRLELVPKVPSFKAIERRLGILKQLASKLSQESMKALIRSPPCSGDPKVFLIAAFTGIKVAATERDVKFAIQFLTHPALLPIWRENDASLSTLATAVADKWPSTTSELVLLLFREALKDVEAAVKAKAAAKVVRRLAARAAKDGGYNFLHGGTAIALRLLVEVVGHLSSSALVPQMIDIVNKLAMPTTDTRTPQTFARDCAPALEALIVRQHESGRWSDEARQQLLMTHGLDIVSAAEGDPSSAIAQTVQHLTLQLQDESVVLRLLDRAPQLQALACQSLMLSVAAAAETKLWLQPKPGAWTGGLNVLLDCLIGPDDALQTRSLAALCAAVGRVGLVAIGGGGVAAMEMLPVLHGQAIRAAPSSPLLELVLSSTGEPMTTIQCADGEVKILSALIKHSSATTFFMEVGATCNLDKHCLLAVRELLRHVVLGAAPHCYVEPDTSGPMALTRLLNLLALARHCQARRLVDALHHELRRRLTDPAAATDVALELTRLECEQTVGGRGVQLWLLSGSALPTEEVLLWLRSKSVADLRPDAVYLLGGSRAEDAASYASTDLSHSFPHMSR